MQLNRLACALALALPLSVFAAPKSGIDLSNFDPTVRIQDDLYLAINGGWDKKTDIPADRVRWGAFDQLRDLSEQRVHSIVENAGKQDDASARQIAAFYASFMDEARADKLGITPLQPLLGKIDEIKDTAGLVRALGSMQQLAINLPIRIGVRQDSKDSTRYQLGVYQSGLGLPDRDYYTEQDARFAKARDAYRSYLITLFTLNGDKEADATRKVDAVIALETRLAKAQWSKVENRNPEKTYNKLDLAGLTALSPEIDWAGLLDAAEANQAKDVNVSQPSYVQTLGKLLASEPVSVWRDYLRAHLLDDFAPTLSKPFVTANFLYRDQTLSGAKEMRPRWKRGVGFIEGNLGEAVGKLYVAQYFPPAAKQKMETLVGNLMKAYAESIDKLAWMSPATKARAQDKLANYGVKIGYPSKWIDYSALVVKSDDLVGNVVRGAQFAYRRNLAHLGQPIDREEWGMTPQTVNAYYSPSKNEIVFPAAILQAPFFDADADDAVNYGGIGAVIGHEISHGFDDQGSQFDGKGNLQNWWQETDRQAFTGLADRMVAQYNQYQPIAGRFVNGKLTLGENIADLSGLQIAYKAYQLSLAGKPAEKLDGFNGDQRFFIGFAQVWRGKVREERQLQLLTMDPHSPGRYRPIGAAVNSDAFIAAFGVKPGDGMYKPENERIRIW
ncbi:M13 family metallopeptidase [Chitinimonas naiadis]